MKFYIQIEYERNCTRFRIKCLVAFVNDLTLYLLLVSSVFDPAELFEYSVARSFKISLLLYGTVFSYSDNFGALFTAFFRFTSQSFSLSSFSVPYVSYFLPYTGQSIHLVTILFFLGIVL